MFVHHFSSNSGKDLILDYINSLTVEEQVDALSVLECLEKGEMDQIYFKHWYKKVYEVYFKKHNRIFYVTMDSENIYLLHACRKQKNKTEKLDRKIVIQRAKELEKEAGKKFV